MKFRNGTKFTAILLIMSALLAACGNDAPMYTGSYNVLTNVIIENQSTDFASYYASIKDGINASFRNMFDMVMNG